MSSRSSRISLFIDGANLHSTARALGFDIDYRRLRQEFDKRGEVLRAFYYTSVIDNSVRPLLDWLNYNGYTVVTKPAKESFDADGRRRIKGKMEVELAVDAMEMAVQIDEMVLFSGDGEYRRLVEAMQRRGVKVTVVSSIATQPPMIADELRRQADVFTDLLTLKPLIGRLPPK
jgi:uncharacterized LabA/DUF88 family protein